MSLTNAFIQISAGDLYGAYMQVIMLATGFPTLAHTWWVGVWRPYHVERGDLSVYCTVVRGCGYSLYAVVNMQDYTLCATVTVLVLAMWLFS